MPALTIVFADLAGFSAATDVHGDEIAADLASRLAQCARASLGSDDRLVKSIGDAVMCSSPTPGRAIVFVHALLDAASREPGFPELRVGLHHGEVIERDHDLFGATVNVAARVTGHARAGQILATTPVSAAAQAAGVPVVDLGVFELRNVSEPTGLFEIDLGCRSCGISIDPVCQMRIERERAPIRVRHEGHELWFCSLDCVARFAATPDRYLAFARDLRSCE